MTPDTHTAVSTLLGPAALGALAGPEAARVDRHVATCRTCRDELTALTALVGDLDLLTPDEAMGLGLLATPTFTTALADEVVLRAGQQQRDARRRGRAVQSLLAGAAAVAVLTSGVVTAAALQRDTTPAGPQVEAVAVSAPGLRASAGLVAHTWGMEIKLQASGFTVGAAYDVEVVTRDGATRTAGAFVGTGARVLSCNLNSAVLRQDAAMFRVLDARGAAVLTGRL